MSMKSWWYRIFGRPVKHWGYFPPRPSEPPDSERPPDSSTGSITYPTEEANHCLCCGNRAEMYGTGSADSRGVVSAESEEVCVPCLEGGCPCAGRHLAQPGTRYSYKRVGRPLPPPRLEPDKIDKGFPPLGWPNIRWPPWRK